MINQDIVNKIDSLLDKGVTSKLSESANPGDMSLQQVVSYALGEGVSDRPSCVGEEVRIFVIFINYNYWSSDYARGKGMRDLAIAQLGSNSLNQEEFLEKLSFRLITKMLPAMFRDLGEEKWEKEIKSLEGAKDLKEAKEATHDVYRTACSASDDSAYSVSRAIRYADDASYAADYASHAASYASDATKTGNKYLEMASHLAVEVLKEMGSPGCQFI